MRIAAGPRHWLWLLLLACLTAFAQQAIPTLEARVTDLTGTLSSPQREALERRLSEFEARKGSQIAVLIVPTTEPESIEQYSMRVAEQWKLGRKGVDDGALLLVAMLQLASPAGRPWSIALRAQPVPHAGIALALIAGALVLLVEEQVRCRRAHREPA